MTIIKFKRKKVEVDYTAIYLDALLRKSHEAKVDMSNRQLQLQLAYYGVKYVGSLKKYGVTQEELQCNAGIAEVVTAKLAALTPKELQQIFPPEKIYDGAKWQTKDYYSTMEAINKFDAHRHIGVDELDDLLWDYHNWNINKFVIGKLMVYSDIKRQQTGKGIMEDFAEKYNIQTYRMITDPKGQQRLLKMKLPKKKRNHLRLVK